MRSPRARTALFATYLVLEAAYLLWRAGFTLSADHPIYAAIFYAAEVFAILTSFVFYLLIFRRAEAPEPPPLASAPDVDVLIATYDEEPDLIRTTAVAARDMEGPHRTFVCDDGHRPEIEALARELGVGYITRPRNDHYKAGNLNHALSRTRGELLLVLDADHVPRREMLARLAGHFADPRVALVQTPQVYYNVDSYQHSVSTRRRRLWHEAAVFHHQMQPGAARLNAAFFVGTGALLRRSALAAVGGFATESITEDIHTSMRLHAAGYRSVYVDEALGFLLAPDTPFAYACQRLRWAQGAMQILRRENPLRVRGLSVWQRLGYLNSLASYLAAYQHLVFFLAPALFLALGLSPIAIDPAVGFPIFVAHIVVDLAIYSLLAAPHARLFLGECYKLLTFAIYLRASLALFKPGGLPFRVTPKGRHGGLPLALVLPAAILFLLNLTAVGLGLTRLARGDVYTGAVVLATFFAAQFAVAGALALVHAYERRGADEPFSFPVSFGSTFSPVTEAVPARGDVPVRVRRLNHQVAYVVADRALERGARVRLDLTPTGVARAVLARVEGHEPQDRSTRSERIVKLSLLDLLPEERDLLDRFLFNTALPEFFAGFADASSAPPPEGRGPGLPDAESRVREFLPVRSEIL